MGSQDRVVTEVFVRMRYKKKKKSDRQERLEIIQHTSEGKHRFAECVSVAIWTFTVAI